MTVDAPEPFCDFGRNGRKSAPVLGSGSCDRGAGYCRFEGEKLEEDDETPPPAMRSHSISGMGPSKTLIFISIKERAFFGYGMFHLCAEK